MQTSDIDLTIDQLVAQLFDEKPELTRQARDARLGVHHIAEQITSQFGSQIGSPEEQARVGNLTDKLEVARSRRYAARAPHVLWPRDYWYLFDFTYGLLGAGIVIAELLRPSITHELARVILELIRGPNESLSDSSIRIIVILFGLVLFVSTFFARRISFRQEKIHHDRLVHSLLAEIDTLSSAIEAQVESMYSHFKETQLLPAVIETINQSRTPRYHSSLKDVSFSGLTQAFSPRFEVPTKHREAVLQAIRQMSGGSVGVAGPRGVGKSTILNSVCSPSTTLPNGKGKTLAWVASAPVEYDSRDFIFYLFSSLCRTVQSVRAAEDPSRRSAALWSAEIDEPPGTSQLLPVRIRPLTSFISVIAGVSISVGALIATSLGPEWDRIGKPLLKVGISPATSFWAGLVLALLGVATLRDWYERRRFHLRMQGQPWDRDLDIADALETEADLSLLSERLVRAMKFQQSYSAGWGGGLRLPIGIEASITRSRQLARSQISLPEIIHAYRAFMDRVVPEYDVLIGIDELDKLESPQRAEKLLNDLKALFDIGGCFYFLSISENALASFESRGVPVRDVMDSSLDDVIRVDYLSFDDSRGLLNRRVVNLPEPFVALCHCLSGGLPRDLIRHCRAIAQVTDQREGEDQHAQNLVAVADAVLWRDLTSRTKAFVFAIEKSNSSNAFADILHDAVTVEHRGKQASELLTASGNLLTKAQAIRIEAKSVTPVDESTLRTAGTCESYAIYVRYIATLREIFTASRDELFWKEFIGNGVADELSRVPQQLGGVPNAANLLLGSVRQQLGLDPPTQPPLEIVAQSGSGSESQPA